MHPIPALLSIVLTLAALPLAGTAAVASAAGSDALSGELVVSRWTWDGTRGTYAVDPGTGSLSRQITPGLEGVYSPNRSQLAYTFDGDSCLPTLGCDWQPDLMTSTASGDDARILVQAAPDEVGFASVNRPNWSPNGKRIVFDSTTGGGGISWIKSDGTGYKTLTSGSSATFSPDGSKIAFERTVPSNDPDDPTGSAVFVMDLKSRAVQRVTRDAIAYATPQWSPDGTHLIYGSVYGVQSVDLSSGTETNLGDSRNWSASLDLVGSAVYSPDGTKIAFIGRDYNTGTHDLYVVNSDGSDLRDIGEGPGQLTQWIN